MAELSARSLQLFLVMSELFQGNKVPDSHERTADLKKRDYHLDSGSEACKSFDFAGSEGADHGTGSGVGNSYDSADSSAEDFVDNSDSGGFAYFVG